MELVSDQGSLPSYILVNKGLMDTKEPVPEPASVR